MQSESGTGSTFTLYVPMNFDIARHGDAAPKTAPAVTPTRPIVVPGSEEGLVLPQNHPVSDDRERIRPGDPVVLIVEDDVKFASILVDLAREKGFKAILSHAGTPAMPMARKYRPDAVMLDIGLPDLDGWALLDLLKRDPHTRHIPVHVISAKEERRRGLAMGAFDYTQKPADREAIFAALAKVKGFVERHQRRLLIVEKVPSTETGGIAGLIDNDDIEISTVTSAEAARAALAKERFDCMVLDLTIPQPADFELIDSLRTRDSTAWMPVVAYVSDGIAPEDEARLRRLAETVVLRSVRSPDSLLDETALFLHRAVDRLPDDKRSALDQIRQRDPVLAGRKVLIVDDDFRNIFSLASVLETHDMTVLHAESGPEGLDLLKAHPDLDVALVDIMMPLMDGYETIREIRATEAGRGLPVIAVTAKAMKGDREKCIEAGATDYLAKPVDIDHLLSLLRVWAGRRQDAAPDVGPSAGAE